MPETKSQQGREFDETCRVCICICKESRKTRSNYEKGVNKQKVRRTIGNESQGPFQFVSV